MPRQWRASVWLNRYQAEIRGCLLSDLEFSALDKHFARFIAAFADEDERVGVAAALVSMASRQGHTCLELGEWAGRDVLAVSGHTLRIPELGRWCKILGECRGVGTGPGNTPLVMEEDRLYLRRYWEYEEEVAREFLRRGGDACLPCDDRLLSAGLARYFPSAPGGDNDAQRLAALVAVTRPLTVITGGPGTGKTTTVAKILALLAGQHPRHDRFFRVALAAPTGKAAMRLQESISLVKKQSMSLHDGDAVDIFPEQVLTIHRLLGVVGGSASFRHDEKNPLPYDLVVVDEASMVDLPMMAKLLRSLKPETGLILLGDRHQLASVEPGSVLGDLCHPTASASFAVESSSRVGRMEMAVAQGAPPGTFTLVDSLVELRRSHRFSKAGGIGRLGAMVMAGDVDGAWEVLFDPASSDVAWHEIASPEGLESLMPRLVPDWFAELQDMEPEEALAVNERFRVLCAVRLGPFGAEQMNARLERFLGQAAGGIHYPGRPVMVLRNDYELGVYNGDVGIIFPDQEKAGALQACFPSQAGGVRKISAARLPEHQTVFAMTVHKSQGSEFDRVVLVLPEHHAPVVSRELLFTAITRARAQVEILGRRQVFEQAVATSAERRSGLREKLWRDRIAPANR